MAEGWRGILSSGGSSQRRPMPRVVIPAGPAPCFALLPPPKPRWTSLAVSLLTQSAGLALLLCIPLFAARTLPVPQYETVALLPPQTLTLSPQPLSVAPPIVRLPAPKMALAEMPLHIRPPKLVAPVPDPVAPPEVRSAYLPAELSESPRPAKPLPEVRMGVLAAANIPLPALREPPARVQTGGFGNPLGQSGDARPGRLTVDRVGSFDLPAGQGLGNGARGPKGASGIVVEAGFGKSTAAVTPSSSGGSSAVRTGAFGDARTAPEASRKAAASAPPPTVPVEILSKPAPAYTEEARRLRIEGEILVEVVFTAGGEVRVLRVLQGLGHGLDESAIQAAKQLRFRPARRDGLPVDSNAKLHILFQLAY